MCRTEDNRLKYFAVYSLKDVLFESVDNHNILSFSKGTRFCNEL